MDERVWIGGALLALLFAAGSRSRSRPSGPSTAEYVRPSSAEDIRSLQRNLNDLRARYLANGGRFGLWGMVDFVDGSQLCPAGPLVVSGVFTDCTREALITFEGLIEHLGSQLRDFPQTVLEVTTRNGVWSKEAVSSYIARVFSTQKSTREAVSYLDEEAGYLGSPPISGS